LIKFLESNKIPKNEIVNFFADKKNDETINIGYDKLRLKGVFAVPTYIVNGRIQFNSSVVDIDNLIKKELEKR